MGIMHRSLGCNNMYVLEHIHIIGYTWSLGCTNMYVLVDRTTHEARAHTYYWLQLEFGLHVGCGGCRKESNAAKAEGHGGRDRHTLTCPDPTTHPSPPSRKASPLTAAAQPPNAISHMYVLVDRTTHEGEHSHLMPSHINMYALVDRTTHDTCPCCTAT